MTINDINTNKWNSNEKKKVTKKNTKLNSKLFWTVKSKMEWIWTIVPRWVFNWYMMYVYCALYSCAHRKYYLCDTYKHSNHFIARLHYFSFFAFNLLTAVALVKAVCMHNTKLHIIQIYEENCGCMDNYEYLNNICIRMLTSKYKILSWNKNTIIVGTMLSLWSANGKRI